MENNLDNTVDVTPVTSKSQSLRLTLEKLDGGFISDITGKRAIYRDAEDIIDVLNFNKVIGRLEHAEYKFNIDIIHKDDHQDILDLIDLRSNYKAEEIASIDDAKNAGIIEVEKFNPFPAEPVLDMDAPIKVTASNAYSVARLKGIDWAGLHDQLFMEPSEIARITGMNVTTLYASLRKVRDGKFSFQHGKARIGFTVLAMYYERTLGVRTSTKDSCEKMKEDMLKLIREIELIGSGKQFVKTTEVSKRLVSMRTMLL